MKTLEFLSRPWCPDDLLKSENACSDIQNLKTLEKTKKNPECYMTFGLF